MIDDLYSTRLLELAGNISHIGRLENAHASASELSRLCGSKVTIDLRMENDVVTDFAHEVKACALGQASSAIMAAHVIGASGDELLELVKTMRAMLQENGAPPAGKWADCALLLPVRAYKARHASTLLTFEAVARAVREIRQNTSSKNRSKNTSKKNSSLACNG